MGRQFLGKMMVSNLVNIAIDATNLRRGGGVTHIVELLAALEGRDFGVGKVVVFCGSLLASKLSNNSSVDVRVPPDLDAGFLRRLIWQRFHLARVAREAGCDVLFVPGGVFSTSFRPIVTMSRNLLPFEYRELRRYGFSWMAVKLILLRFLQTRSMRKANGVIFLTEYAKKTVSAVVGNYEGMTDIVPHGMNSRFDFQPKPQKEINSYSVHNPFRVIYVSVVEPYKHQWKVVEAVAKLRKSGAPVVLDLVGPFYEPSLKKLKRVINELDPGGDWVKYHGAVDYKELDKFYAGADLGVFASSCENMPNILVETMAAGLPVACSRMGPMSEILGDSGLYFDPEDSDSIEACISRFVHDPALRAEKAEQSYARSKVYSWTLCAERTFGFLNKVGRCTNSMRKDSL